MVTRRDRQGEPTCTFTIVDGVRLQIYRHIARPGAWTVYAYGLLGERALEAVSLDEARHEALALLENARAQLEVGDR